MGHSHSHSHSHEFSPFTPLAHKIFPFDSLSNTVLAISFITGITQTLMAIVPSLGANQLAFLVAFAEGGMLGTIFLHILPEIEYSTLSGIWLLIGFMTFVIIDKSMRIFTGFNEQHSHTHIGQESGVSSNEKKFPGLKNRQKQKSTGEHTHSHAYSADKPHGSTSNLTPWLNIFADSLHNVTDGISLALAFSNGVGTGFTAFLVMCCHEVPHQFGDFALLINAGASKRSARKAQLITALGTLLGAILGNRIGILGSKFEEIISAATAGVFLYVSTVGVLPEILETNNKCSKKRQLTTAAVQLIGVISGAAILLFLD